MNSRELFNTKNRIKTIQGNGSKINLNISKIKSQKYLKKSITPRKNKKNDNYNNSRKKILEPFHQKRMPNFFINNNTLNNENYEQKISQDIFRTNTQNYYQNYNIKINDNILIETKDNNFALNKSTKLIKIENNIIKALNNMRIDIEKNNQKETNISPRNMINKKASCPNLVKIYKIKKSKNKKEARSSTIIQETNIFNTNFSFKGKFIHKRSKSLDFTKFRKK